MPTSAGWKSVFGLASALLCAIFLCPIPPRAPFYTWELIGRAAGYVIAIAIATNLAIGFGRLAPGFRTRLLAAALWCAPLIVLGIRASALAAVAVIAIAALATPLFGFSRRPPPPSGDSRLLRQFPSSIIAAILIQFAAVEALLKHSEVAAVSLAAAVALMTWRATAVDPKARLKPLLTVALVSTAFIALIIGMLPFRMTFANYDSQVAGSAGNADQRGPKGDGDTLADTYRGIILLPEVTKHVTLIAPLPALQKNSFRENKRSLEIPFYGVYWFFRRPDLRPPKDAVEMHGSPATMTFRSHDHRPLVVEAHQSLGTSFPISCCGSIVLAITNRNREKGTVSIELVLVDTFSLSKPSQSLGLLPVQSIFRLGDVGPGVSEELEFPIPPSPAIRQFDEFSVRFHRPFMMARASANVAIDGFTLKPR
jgi:hypothetical protein